MYKLLLAAGTASLALAAPAGAHPGANHSQGKHAYHKQTVHHGRGRGQAGSFSDASQARARADYWGNASCPPGLAKKHNGCLPPGIHKRSFNVGDRWNGNYSPWRYDQIPTDWRSRYNLDSDSRYYYRDGYLYGVDPKTRLVESVIQALIR